MFTVRDIQQTNLKLNDKGIYLIHSKTTGKDYIGSTTKSFYIRWTQHINDLLNSKHHNINITNLYINNTIDDFVFIILESLTDTTNILDIEKQYISKWNPELNIGITKQLSLFDTKQFVIQQDVKSTKGVFKSKDKFGAKLLIHNKRLTLGYFNTKQEAILAVDLGTKLFNSKSYISKDKQSQLQFIYSFYGFLYKDVPQDPIKYLNDLLLRD